MSVSIGKMNKLIVARQSDSGLYLAISEQDSILLPNRYVPENTEIGDKLEVFVHLDSDDRLIATTEQPKAMVGEIKQLQCKDVNFVGAFLDWGLGKDLLVPFSEQYHEMQVDRWYLVYLYVDKASQRIAASSRLDKFIDNSPASFEPNQAVNLIIRNKTDLGYNAIINNTHSGLIFDNDIFRPLRVGQEIKGYIKTIRDDGKIDLSLQQRVAQAMDEFSEKIIEALKANEGFLALNDKSKPELIYKLFNVSKATFKRSIGKLYKQRLITIESTGIRLIEQAEE